MPSSDPKDTKAKAPDTDRHRTPPHLQQPNWHHIVQTLVNVVPLMVVVLGSVFWLHGEILKNRYSSDAALQQIEHLSSRVAQVEQRVEAKIEQFGRQFAGTEEVRRDRERVDRDMESLRKQVETLTGAVSTLTRQVDRLVAKMEDGGR